MNETRPFRPTTGPRALKTWIPAIQLLLLGACTGVVGDNGGSGAEFLETVPEPVAAIAAPYQDLQSVRLLPEDRCYWYRHVGPVETTLLPLRTVDGRPICRRSEIVVES